MTSIDTNPAPPRVRINATMTDPEGNTVELFPGGSDACDPWIARGALVLLTARVDLVLVLARVRALGIRKWHRFDRTDRMGGELHVAANQTRVFAQACRQARWDGSPLPSVAGLEKACTAALEVCAWLVTGQYIDQCLSTGEVPKDRQDAIHGIASGEVFKQINRAVIMHAAASNVPPRTEADLTTSGYATAELTAMLLVSALREVSAAFLRLHDLALGEVLDNEGPQDGMLISADELRRDVEQASALLDDVMEILREGVAFTLGKLPRVPPLPN